MRCLLLLVALFGASCQWSEQAREVAVEASPAVTPRHEVPGAEPAPLSPAQESELRALPWAGDASAHFVKPFHGQWSVSGAWAGEPGGRRSLTSASYALRYGLPSQDIGFIVVDTAAEELLLKLYEGRAFTEDDIRFSMPLKGSVEALSVELAHDKIAVLRWDDARPQLSVYSQADKSQAWSRQLDIADAIGPLVLAWYPDQTVSVEWRSAENYQRFLLEPETGAVRVHQELDPRIVKVIHAPVEFILAAPPPDAEPDTADDVELTTAERWVRNPQSIASRCPGHAPMDDSDETRVVRAVELDEGILLAAEALHFTDARREPRPLTVDSATCTSVELYDTETIQNLGSWSTFRPEL